MNSAHGRQQALHNSATRGNWSEFTEHRCKVAALLLNQAAASKSLAVVGAGNTNDLDLPILSQNFASITLIDLDGEAMRAGVARQFPQSQPVNLEIFEFEVTGAMESFDQLQACQDETSRAITITALLAKLANPPVFSDKKYDVVLSAGLLSQLIGMAKSSLGEEHPQFVTLVQAIRRQHLLAMHQLTTPGGITTILLDFVSSLTAPSIVEAHERNLAQIAQMLIAQRNFFTGLNPVVVKKSWQDLLNSAGEKVEVQLSECWRWNLGPRTYLVTALSAKKS